MVLDFFGSPVLFCANRLCWGNRFWGSLWSCPVDRFSLANLFCISACCLQFYSGITFTLYKSLGIDNFFGLILLFAAVFVGVMIIISLATILLYCLPGILIGYAVYSATESSFLTVVTFLIITVGVVVLVYYFSKYVLPFIFGYGMNWISVILANQLGASIMLGFSVYTLFEGGRDFYAQPDIYGLMDMANAFSPVIGLIKAITYLPGILVFWSVISGIFFGLLNTPIRTTFMKTGEVVPKFRHLDSGNPSARPVPVATPNLVPDLLQQDSSDEIFCWNCGSKGLKNHQYCAECGADLNLGK
jgi:hypothetical protein